MNLAFAKANVAVLKPKMDAADGVTPQKKSLVPAAIGIVAGNLGAFLLTRLVAHLLYTVSATDPAIFLPSTLLLTLSCVAASALPALRSSRVSPALLLQAE